MQKSHWAYNYAERVIRECGDKESYVCASGITPSGIVHFGNFREVISVELVVRALQNMGKKTTFLYFWDDYDVMRKRGKDIPEHYDDYLGQSISAVPDPAGKATSFAEANALRFTDCLPKLGIEAEFVSQAERYQSCCYAEEMATALAASKEIRKILNQYRSDDLPADWWPISIYSRFSGSDRCSILEWDGSWNIRYRCHDTDQEDEIDIRKDAGAKLFWRVDWPMRWKHYGVDFEPAGKDHHSDGGSFTTASIIAQEIFKQKIPVSFQYDFVGIKGRGGKMSSSTGENVALDEVMSVYQPEVLRYHFASTRPNREFALSFDLDVIKIYEDYDRCERIYYDDNASSKKEGERYIYELSQVASPSPAISTQIPFRHLCNLIQIMNGDVQETLDSYYASTAEMRQSLDRAHCAAEWVKTWAPEDFRFQLRNPQDALALSEQQLMAVEGIAQAIIDQQIAYEEKEIIGLIKKTAEEVELPLTDVFVAMYQALIGRDKGPRLASFMVQIGRDSVLERIRN